MSGSVARRSVRIFIEGRVQGVGYRAWLERAAQRLDLDGWVRNRRDGRVEAVLSGTPEDVERMVEQCARGPSAARVDAVRVSDEPGPIAAGFPVLPTI
jgi:acylphosphatase